VPWHDTYVGSLVNLQVVELIVSMANIRSMAFDFLLHIRARYCVAVVVVPFIYSLHE
jgi:hypothetical protein